MKTNLSKIGFKKVFPDRLDKKYFYWRRDLKHNFLKGLHIIIDEKINVYCNEPRVGPKNEVLICSLEPTDTNLELIAAWLYIGK